MKQQRAPLFALLESDDSASIDALLQESEEVRNELNPQGTKPPLAFTRSVEAARLLIEHGADVDRVGTWWAPGFGILKVDRQVGRFLVEQGAAQFEIWTERRAPVRVMKQAARRALKGTEK